MTPVHSRRPAGSTLSDGYRTVDVMGSAFLLNAFAGFGPAARLPVIPRALVTWVAAVGTLVVLAALAVLCRERQGA